MKRTIGGIVVATLVLTGLPAWATENDPLARPFGQATPGQFRLSFDRAVASIVNSPARSTKPDRGGHGWRRDTRRLSPSSP